MEVELNFVHFEKVSFVHSVAPPLYDCTVN